MAQNSFLGTGWSFPPAFNAEESVVNLVSEEQDIRESLHILLSTRKGERVLLPTYGCNLDEYLFQAMNLTVKTRVIELIKTAILFFEPRIELDRVSIDVVNELKGELQIELHYRIINSNTRSNMVFPFYQREGSPI